MDYERTSKRARYDAQVDLSQFNSCTALTIKENKKIEVIEGCEALCVLSLTRTIVKTVANCPRLHTFDIIDNNGLTSILLPSTLQARIADCRDLQHLELTRALSVYLDDLPKLTRLQIPVVRELVFSNFQWTSTFSMITQLSNLRVLKIINVTNVQETLLQVLPCSVEVMVIKNCSISTLTGVTGRRELTVSRCSLLTSIENISDVATIAISGCDNLYYIRNVSKSTMVVNNCNRLVTLDELRLGKLIVEYCFRLVVISKLDVRRLCVRRCPLLKELFVHTKTTRLTVDHCNALDSVNFSDTPILSYTELHIEMYGDTKIRIIKDWYVATLLVKANTYLEQIKGVCNLDSLSLIECSNLQTIHNLFVRKNMTIESCVNLVSFNNVYGYANLSIVDCPRLTTLGMRLIPSKIAILHCPALNICVDGSILKCISLGNCGIGLVRNFSLLTELDIHQVRGIPDMRSTSGTQTIVACRFAERMRRFETISRLLARWFRALHARRRYQKYLSLKASNDLYDCPICQEPTELENASFTRCEHLFHSGCIAQWMCIRQRCPVCNGK
jgi:hypothetical protein